MPNLFEHSQLKAQKKIIVLKFKNILVRFLILKEII